MTLFLDNDVLLKLASWDLLQVSVEACGVTVSDARFLPTAPFWLGMIGEKRKPRCPTEVQDRLRSFFVTAQSCSDDAARHDGTLPAVDDIDAGEAILLAQTAASPGAFLATGDKRCILALAGSPACATLVSLLEGRLLCLEQMLLRAMDQAGFAEVKQRVVGSDQLALDTSVGEHEEPRDLDHLPALLLGLSLVP